MSTQRSQFPFGPSNYKWMLAGIAIILVGFLLMSWDSKEFGFGTLGLTVGPIVIMLGFILEFWAILRKPNKA